MKALLAAALSIVGVVAQANEAIKVWPEFPHEPVAWVEIGPPQIEDAIATITFKNTGVHGGLETFELTFEGITYGFELDPVYNTMADDRLLVIPPSGYFAYPPQLILDDAGSTDVMHIFEEDSTPSS